MSPMMFPFLTGMVPPLVKEKLGVARPELVSDPPPAMEVAGYPPISPEADAEARRLLGTPVGIGNLQQGRMGPLFGLGQYINQELAQENQGEVNEFIGEVGDMANQRFGVDLGSVGQRSMFRPELMRAMGGPIQGYKDGGAAFPDVTGPGGGPPDGKVTQADVLKLRGVELKEYGGPIGMQMGGDPMMAAAMPPPMPAPEQPPMPMEDQLDPNVVQSALAQAAGGIGDLDQAQNYEQVMNTMRGDQATVEERREELAGVVGPGDANQTPESVLTLVQPVMMLANVDQGIGQLAQQEMTQPMEGPMAGGIMSTVPEPPMMEAGGTAPVNFNKGGEVRPIQYFENAGVVSGLGNFRLGQLGIDLSQPFKGTVVQSAVDKAAEEEQSAPGTVTKDRFNEIFDQTYAAYSKFGADPESTQRQKDLTKAQMLFDIAKTALAFAAPMPGERPGLSPAERLAMAATTTQLPDKIAARAQTQLEAEKAADKEKRALGLAALQSTETKVAAEKAAAQALELAGVKAGSTKPVKLKPGEVLYSADGELIAKGPSETFTLGEGQVRTNAKGEILAKGPAKTYTLSEGEVVFDATGKEVMRGSEKMRILKPGDVVVDSKGAIKAKGPPKTITLSEGQVLVDAAGKEIAKGDDKSYVLNPGDVVMQGGEVINRAPAKQVKVGPGEKIIDLETKEVVVEGDGKLYKLSKDQVLIDETGQVKASGASTTNLNLVDFDKGSRQSQLEFFQKNLELGRRYANNKTKEWENNTLHLMIENFTKDIISDVPGANKAGGILSEEWKGFIKKRQELATANPSLNISLPTSYLEMVPPPSFEKDRDTNIPIDDGQETTAYDSSISLLKVTPDKELPPATFKRLLNEIDPSKAVGSVEALGNLINKGSELLSFMVRKPFPNVAQSVEVMKNFNLNAQLAYLQTIKGKPADELRKEVKAALPQPAQFFGGDESAFNSARGAEAFFNQRANELRIEANYLEKVYGKTRTAELGTIYAQINSMQTIAKGYNKLARGFQQRFAIRETGGKGPKNFNIFNYIDVDQDKEK